MAKNIFMMHAEKWSQVVEHMTSFWKKQDIARGILGDDGVDALMTTSAMSLEKLQEVVDEYIIQGFNGIFIRSLNPYGFAAEQSSQLGYSQEAFAKQYLEVLGYIIKLNRSFFSQNILQLSFFRGYSHLLQQDLSICNLRPAQESAE